jgi:16S rRNA A1518/A1519 N6-dimethyltransferase RsmA/KsgA/DIM1 with predicted DNA glycosylase/AP lyase activity
MFFLNLIFSYKTKIFLIIFYEIKFFFFSFKINSINILDNKKFTDNIPAPYYFLNSINKYIKDKKIKSLIDLGCGSGRALHFFYKKNFKLKEIYGLEYNYNIYKKTKKFFVNNKKVKIFNKDVLNFNFKKKKFNCYLLVDPFKTKKDYELVINKIKNANNNKKITIIIVNCTKKIKALKNFKLVRSLVVNNRGYKIYNTKTINF